MPKVVHSVEFNDSGAWSFALVKDQGEGGPNNFDLLVKKEGEGGWESYNNVPEGTDSGHWREP